MKINIQFGPPGANKTNKQVMKRKEQLYLKPEMVLRYLITEDEALNTLILCKSSEYHITTSDANMYQALGSIKSEDIFKLNKLVKFLEVVHVFSTVHAGRNKLVLKENRVAELRKLALTKPFGGKEHGKNNRN